MEWHHYFLGLIGSMSIVHLLSLAGQSFRELYPKKQLASGHPATATKRDDWYVFFHCADLLGKEKVASLSMPSLEKQPVSEVKNHQKKVQRPRIRARLS